MRILRVADSFMLKNGLGLAFDNVTDYFKPKVGDAITIISPNDVFITSTILGIELWARAIEYPNDPFSILVPGFTEYIDMRGWDCLFH
jgi:hypothetical protein